MRRCPFAGGAAQQAGRPASGCTSSRFWQVNIHWGNCGKKVGGRWCWLVPRGQVYAQAPKTPGTTTTASRWRPQECGKQTPFDLGGRPVPSGARAARTACWCAWLDALDAVQYHHVLCSRCWQNGFNTPVLKHGPRRLARLRVFGWRKPGRVTKVKGGVGRLRWEGRVLAPGWHHRPLWTTLTFERCE